MELVTLDNIVIGARVKLVNLRPYAEVSEECPKVGSRFECLGMIRFVHCFVIGVKWDNGKLGLFIADELAYVDKDKKVNFVDVWQEM